MKKGKVYLHVGCPKTGTTSLQNFLYQNRGLLNDLGYLYPDVGLAKGQLGHHNLVWELPFSKPGSRDNFDPEQGGAEDLAREISNFPDKHILLSSEAFTECLLSAKCSENLDQTLMPGLRDREINYIISLRRADFWLESLVSYTLIQKVMEGNTLSSDQGLFTLFLKIDDLIHNNKPTFDIELINSLLSRAEHNRVKLINNTDLVEKYCEIIDINLAKNNNFLKNTKDENKSDKKLAALCHLMITSPHYGKIKHQIRDRSGLLKKALNPVSFKFRFISKFKIQKMLEKVIPEHERICKSLDIRTPMFDYSIDDFEYVPLKALHLLFDDNEKHEINEILNYKLFAH